MEVASCHHSSTMILRWFLNTWKIYAPLHNILNMFPMCNTIVLKFPAQYFTSSLQSLNILPFVHAHIKIHALKYSDLFRNVCIRKAVHHWRMHTDYWHTEVILTKAYTKRLKDKREPNSNYEEEIKDSHNLLYFCINLISIKVQFLSMTFSDTLDSKHREVIFTHYLL